MIEKKKDEETHESNSMTASKTENQQLIYETISTNACIACQRKKSRIYSSSPSSSSCIGCLNAGPERLAGS